MKILKIFYLAIITGLLSSCDITNLSPKDSFTDDTYWNTVNDLKLYATGLYGNISGPTASGDNGTDNFVTTNYSGYLFNEYTVPSTGGGWTWDRLRSCNYFLQRYTRVVGEESEINKYVAEVRFFRGMIYYDKILTFGDVPYYDKDLQVTDIEELYKPRDKRDYVLEKIIEDFEYAIEWLPSTEKSESGRLNKDAARTQLARICLHYGTYKKYHNESSAPTSNELLQKAAALAKEVIDSGNYEIVKGEDNGCGQLSNPGYPLYYSNQFTQEDLSTNKEGILCRYYKTGILTHETGREAGGAGTGLSKDFVESFLCLDGNPISISPLYKGDEDQASEFSNRDPRIYQIIDNKNKPYIVRNGEKTYNPEADCTANSAVTGYPCVKFRSADTKQSEANNSSYDWFVYRYAEILLIYAEAQAELDLCTQDVLDETINLLRDRVEMPHMTTTPVTDIKPIDYGYTVSNLIYEIRRERRIELIAESFRMNDLKRWNAMKLLENPKTMFGLRITPTVIKDYAKQNVTFGGENGRPTVEYNGETYLYQYAASKNINDAGRKWAKDDRRWLYPLPTTELTLNPNLEQNPGWK